MIGVPARDTYANLLKYSRGLEQAQSLARENWFTSLRWQRKEQTLFSLEMSLKGIVCLGNAHNLTGPPKESSHIARNFRHEVHIVRDTLEHCVNFIRHLLGSRDRTYTFSRYLHGVLPDDSLRHRLVKEQLTQATPVESLMLLRNTFGAYGELAEGLLRLDHVGSRQYFALHSSITREVERNVYFNPLIELEFRTEYDRIQVPEVLEALRSVASNAAHRAVALTFLVLFRCLRYLDLMESYLQDQALTRLTFTLLAVARSDLRALTHYLSENVHDVLADGVEEELLSIKAHQLRTSSAQILRDLQSVVPLRRTLVALSRTLELESRRIFEEQCPSPSGKLEIENLVQQLGGAASDLRAALHETVRTLCTEIRPDRAPPSLASDMSTRIAQSERLRREAWTFAQVLRAFLAKAEATRDYQDLWVGHANFSYVKDFLNHFTTLGYQLLRLSDYDRITSLVRALSALEDTDLLSAELMSRSLDECRRLLKFLEQLFADVSARSELQHVPFKRGAAAEFLKNYLAGNEEGYST